MLAGALSAEARAEVANHAATCEPCHALVESLLDRGREITVGDGARDAELELRPGTQIGRYVIDKRLGAGGMGVVHAALDTELQRRVALKLLRPDPDGDGGSTGRERLLREARTLARLSHQNVVTVFDVGRHQGHVFLAMELVEGGSLTAWLARKPRDADAILARMIEAGRGLAAAHTAGVIHRDVKPDNILVGTDDRARMTDFGLARLGELPPPEGASPDSSALLGGLTRTGTLMGTPAYMAPEHLLRGETNARTDQWSFCATLYEVLAGVRPFPVDDLEARRSAIEHGQLAAPREGHRVSARVRQIVLRGLRADPESRWPSMDAVVKALDRRRPARRYIAASGFVLAAIAGVYVVSRGEPVKQRTEWPGYVDDRPGCSCPLSACKNGCVSVCRAENYEFGGKLVGIDVESRQEALLGAAADGETILFLAGRGCNLERLYVAHRRGPLFVSTDLTHQLDQLDQPVTIFEGCCTLSADGKTVVLPTKDRTAFVTADVEGGRLQPRVNALLRAQQGVSHPVLSADRLTLYFQQQDPAGQLDGNYVVERADPHTAFGPGRRLPGVRQFDYVTGISADGLTLFVAETYETVVLVRASKSDVFSASAVSLTKLPGWRGIPLADCNRVITTWTPGGCHGEDIAFLQAK